MPAEQFDIDAAVDGLAAQLEPLVRELAATPLLQGSALLQLLLEDEAISANALAPPALAALVADALDWCNNVSGLRPPPLSAGPLGAAPNLDFSLGYLQRPYCKALCRALALWHLHGAFPYPGLEASPVELMQELGTYHDAKHTLDGCAKALLGPAGFGSRTGSSAYGAPPPTTRVFRHEHTSSLSAWHTVPDAPTAAQLTLASMPSLLPPWAAGIPSAAVPPRSGFERAASSIPSPTTRPGGGGCAATHDSGSGRMEAGGEAVEGGTSTPASAGAAAAVGPRTCVLEMRVAEGYGMRWMVDGAAGTVSFRGFLEPQQVDGHARGWRH